MTFVAQPVTIGEQKVCPESESESLKFFTTPTPQVENPSDSDSDSSTSTPTPQPWCCILLERLFSSNSNSIIATHARDHSTAMICSVQKCNWLCCSVGCHVFRNRQRKFNDASAYNVRKLHFQTDLCEAFAADKKQYYYEDLVLGWGV